MTEQESLTTGMDIPQDIVEPTEVIESKRPQDFDESLWDAESDSYNPTAIMERIRTAEEAKAKADKQALDMRRKLSKGVEVPDAIDKYEFVADEKYDRYILNEESVEGQHINSVMTDLSQLSLDNGLSVEQSKAFKDFMLHYMEQVSILDTRSEAEIEQAKKDKLAEQRAILGDNAESIIRDNLDFFSNRGPFTMDERKYLRSAIEQSGHANHILRKVKDMMNSVSTADIPTDIDSSGDVESLRIEFMKKDTSEQRREQIVKQASREGWKLV